MYDYYSGIVTTYKKSTILQYPCISVVDNLSNILHFAPCTMHWHCIFLKWTDMGVYKLWLQPHLSWWNDIMLMFLLYCIFHHGNKVLFYSILFYSILFYSILFYSKCWVWDVRMRWISDPDRCLFQYKMWFYWIIQGYDIQKVFS